jgi:cadherin EGF LAG seven-pass G-type receptor 2
VVLSVEGTGLQASSLRLEPGRANDGDWHHAQLALGASGGPGHAILSFDYGQQRAEGNLGPRLHGLHLSNITVGGVPGPASGVARGFRGCLQVSLLLHPPLPLSPNLEPWCTEGQHCSAPVSPGCTDKRST